MLYYLFHAVSGHSLACIDKAKALQQTNVKEVVKIEQAAHIRRCMILGNTKHGGSH